MLQGNSGIVIGDLAGGGAAGTGEGNAVVDVEESLLAAGRTDDSGGVVFLGVDLAVSPDAAAGNGDGGGGGVGGRLGEVVGRVEGRCHARVQLRVAMVGGVDDAEGEACRVLERQVQLAVQGVLRDGRAGSNISLEVVEAEGHNLSLQC